MQPVALRIDPRPVAQVVATMLQAFRRAGAGLASSPSVTDTTYENRTGPGNSSPKAGLHLPAPVHPQTSASTPGEHRTPIRAPGEGPAVGLATGADPHAGSRPGDLRHPDGQPTRFQAPGGGGVIAEGRSGLRLGGLALVALGSGLAPVGGLVRVDRYFTHRRRWSLQPRGFQRPFVVGTQGHDVPGRVALLARPPPGRQAHQGAQRATALSLAGGVRLRRPRGHRFRSGSRGARRRAPGLHCLRTNGQRLWSGSALRRAPVAFPQAQLWRSLERAIAVGPLEPWASARFAAQSSLHWSVCVWSLPNLQKLLAHRPNAPYRSPHAASRLASESAQPTSRLHQLGGILGQPAEAGAEPNEWLPRSHRLCGAGRTRALARSAGLWSVRPAALAALHRRARLPRLVCMQLAPPRTGR